MPFEVEKLPDEPIIICTYHEPFGAEDQPQVFAQVDRLAADLTPPIYRIVDNRDIEFSFSEMMLLMAQETQGIAGSAADPRLVTVIVMQDQLAQFGIKSMQEQEQYGQPQIVAFHTMEEALAYVRGKLAKRGQPA